MKLKQENHIVLNSLSLKDMADFKQENGREFKFPPYLFAFLKDQETNCCRMKML